MTGEATPSNDCALIAVERELELLTELAEMTMVVSRAYAHAAVAAAAAAEAVLADEFYQPETERARAVACARDAADEYQKVTRSLRLTLMSKKAAAAEDLRDLRLGLVPARQTEIAASERSVIPRNETVAERRDSDAVSSATPERVGGEYKRA